MVDQMRALLLTTSCGVVLLAGPVLAESTSSDHLLTPAPASSAPGLSPYEPNPPPGQARPQDEVPHPEAASPVAPLSTPQAPPASPAVDDYSQGHGPRPSFGPPTGEYDHDGFYLRLNVGATVLKAAYSSVGRDWTYTGLGPCMGAAMGSVIGHRLILFGEAQVSMFSDPTLETSGHSSSLDGQNLVSYTLGPGVAYYLDPLGLLFSGTLALSRLSLHQQGKSGNDKTATDLTDLGVAANLQFGKEWWVDLDWGLGAVAQLHVASMKMKDQDARMTVLAFSILISVTYN